MNLSERPRPLLDVSDQTLLSTTTPFDGQRSAVEALMRRIVREEAALHLEDLLLRRLDPATVLANWTKATEVVRTLSFRAVRRRPQCHRSIRSAACVLMAGASTVPRGYLASPPRRFVPSGSKSSTPTPTPVLEHDERPEHMAMVRPAG